MSTNINISKINITFTNNSDKPYKLIKKITVSDDTGMKIIIPEGFTFDGASIPRFLWWLLPRDDIRYIKAACVHDYLYQKHPLSRPRADAIFWTIMDQEKENPVPKYMKWGMYLAVRAFGWKAWSNSYSP